MGTSFTENEEILVGFIISASQVVVFAESVVFDVGILRYGHNGKTAASEKCLLTYVVQLVAEINIGQ